MGSERWLKLRQIVERTGRPLTCPLCSFRFAHRHRFRSAGTCPRCKVPVGFPFYYRVILSVGYLSGAAYTMYRGYVGIGPSWLLLGGPVAMIVGLMVHGSILRAFPPKLEAYSEGNTWVKLS